jgi:hypothetical protein
MERRFARSPFEAWTGGFPQGENGFKNVAEMR